MASNVRKALVAASFSVRRRGLLFLAIPACAAAVASYGLIARADDSVAAGEPGATVPWAFPYQVAGQGGENLDVFLQDPERSSPTATAQSEFDEYSPTLTVDGTSIAFVRNEGDNADIFVVDRDGGGLHRVTSGPATDGGPQWSPDGEWIAFWRDHGAGLPEICVVSSDGKEERQLTSNSVAEIHPSWSPDGRSVAFVRLSEGASEIFSVDVGSGEVAQLTTLGEEMVHPSWSPDGKMIMAARSDDGGASWDLVRIQITTGDVEPVRNNVGSLVASMAWKAEGIVLTASGGDFAKFETVLIDPETGDVLSEFDIPGEPVWQ